MKLRLLALMIGAALLSPALAAEPAKPDDGKSAAARAEIELLVARIKELSPQLGDGNDVRIIVRRGHEDGTPPEHGGIRIERFQHGTPGAEMPGMSRSGIGVVLAPNPAAKGVRIAGVTPNGPASKAGLRSGDILLKINGQAIAGSDRQAVDAAREQLSALKIGDTVKLVAAREGKTMDASVKVDQIARVMMFSSDGGGDFPGMAPMAPMPRTHGEPGGQRHLRVVAPQVEMDLERIGMDRDCRPGQDDCRLPALHEAFRWQGLNLSSLDAGLGRYFGADKGVLVLSTGSELAGLQAGDVIQRVAGNEVKSPREVMRALREKDVGSQLRIDLLRDRKAATVDITVPKARPLPFMTPPPAPPAPPAPPMPPGGPGHAAPPAAPAPPAPPPKGRVAIIEIDGGNGEVVQMAEHQQMWVGDGGDTRIVEIVTSNSD